MASGWASGGDDLVGMALDVELLLSGSDRLDPDSVDVNRTSNREALIAGSCSPAKGVSAEEAALEIERVWLEQISYRYFRASRVQHGGRHEGVPLRDTDRAQWLLCHRPNRVARQSPRGEFHISLEPVLHAPGVLPEQHAAQLGEPVGAEVSEL
jgi:hypothetical protein